MKPILLAVLFSLACTYGVDAQSGAPTQAHLYDPKISAKLQLDSAILEAKQVHKNILLQIGGNWCIWCVRFHNFVSTNDSLKRLQDRNFVTVHLNYSPENKNGQMLARLGFPQRFGFPVFVILNEKGERIHTQNSAYLEEGKGYSAAKVNEFLQHWSPKALEPDTYKNAE